MPNERCAEEFSASEGFNSSGDIPDGYRTGDDIHYKYIHAGGTPSSLHVLPGQDAYKYIQRSTDGMPGQVRQPMCVGGHVTGSGRYVGVRAA